MQHHALAVTGLVPALVLVIVLVCCPGCVSPAVPDEPAQTPPPGPIAISPTPSLSVPVTTVPTSIPVPETTGSRTLPPFTTAAAITQITAAPMTASIDNPHLVLLDFTKDYLTENIPDCGMRAVFPEVAGDPGYGIRPPESRLDGLTEDQVFPVLAGDAAGYRFSGAVPGQDGQEAVTTFDPNTLGGAACVGVPASPTWNFIRIRGNFVPRNARPAEYAIALNVRSRGKVAARMQMNRTLVLDQPFVFTLYVPLKTSEMELFDGLEPVFVKMA